MVIQQSKPDSIALSLTLALWAVATQVHAAPDLHWRALVDVQLTHTSASSPDGTTAPGSRNSWFNGGALGLRYSDSEDFTLGQLGAEFTQRLNPAWQFSATGLAYYQDADDNFEATLTEAFFNYRPVPKSRWRQSARVGWFYAPISLENRGPLWSSPYSTNPSTINTWVGEELRTFGAEWRWQQSQHHNRWGWGMSGFAAIYGFNDTTGAMLGWRGWASHNRQAGVGTEYPIAELPSLNPGRVFEDQERYYSPFVEVDNRPGFYLGGEISRRRDLRVSYLYYDNQADPSALQDGQYGWRTRFQHIGVHWHINSTTELLSQYMTGNTRMGLGPTSQVDADFWSGYTMISKRWGPQRLSLRWDRFEVIDQDRTFRDSNGEHGRALNISYSYLWQKRWKITLEATHWRSERRGRHYIPSASSDPGMPTFSADQNVRIEADQWQLTLRRFW